MILLLGDGRAEMMKRCHTGTAVAVAAMIAVAGSTLVCPVSAESLQQALTSTYRTNPQLDAARGAATSLRVRLFFGILRSDRGECGHVRRPAGLQAVRDGE